MVESADFVGLRDCVYTLFEEDGELECLHLYRNVRISLVMCRSDSDNIYKELMVQTAQAVNLPLRRIHLHLRRRRRRRLPR